MPLEEIKEILSKYEKKENKIKQSFNERSLKYVAEEFTSEQPQNVQLDDAINRNKQILKDLELIKGTLRSKAIFTPTEVQWESICKKYREAPSLPVTTWRCHLPFYV